MQDVYLCIDTDNAWDSNLLSVYVRISTDTSPLNDAHQEKPPCFNSLKESDSTATKPTTCGHTPTHHKPLLEHRYPQKHCSHAVQLIY